MRGLAYYVHRGKIVLLLIGNPLFYSVSWLEIYSEPIKIGVLCCREEGSGCHQVRASLLASSHTQSPPMGKRANPPPTPCTIMATADGRWLGYQMASRPPLGRGRRSRGASPCPAADAKKKRPSLPRGGRSGSNPPPTPVTATHTQYPLGCVCKYWLLSWVRLFYMAVS